MSVRRSFILLLMLACHQDAVAQAPAQGSITIRVDASARQGPWKPIWTYWGYDEPNYTYTPNGRKLISELSALSPSAIWIRTHHLLCTGDGTPALKWGSTNAYTEDPSGQPLYDWTIIDRIFDTYLQAGAKPFVEIGFMPEALSLHPEPYTRHWPAPDDGKGWAYPPKDYDKWARLISQWVQHSIDRYGRNEVESWYWEVWNEPDISYWRGTPEEYDKLYDYAAMAVKRILPAGRVGGPASTGPANPQAAAFLQQFLQHCAQGTNYATGTIGAPLDFITYHAKGAVKITEGHVQMGLARNLQDVAKGFEIVKSFSQFRSLPIILSESDPEGCAACSARRYPQDAYRNGTLYPCYIATALNGILAMAQRYGVNIEGMLTWAFEFEGQPYFEGFRTLATNGVDKPVLNFFRMMGLMRGERLLVTSNGAVGLDEILNAGVRSHSDVDAIATRLGQEISVLVWNYHDDDLPGPDAPVTLAVRGMPGVRRILVHHYRIDSHHSNAYTVWKEMGSPQNPSPEEYARLEAGGNLQLLTSPSWQGVNGGEIAVTFSLPRQAVSLVQLSW